MKLKSRTPALLDQLDFDILTLLNSDFEYYKLSDVVSKFNISWKALSFHIKKIHSFGFIERCRGDGLNHRSKFIRITNEGSLVHYLFEIKRQKENKATKGKKE